MRAWQATLLVVVAGVIGLATGSRPIEIAAVALVVVLIIGAIYRGLQVGDVRGVRQVSGDIVPWGGVLSQQITLTNQSRLSMPALRITDQSTLPEHPHGYVTSLKPRRSITWDVEIPCRRRGRYRLGPVEVHMSDPLGLFPVQRQLSAASSVLVLPRWVTLKRSALKLDGFMAGEALGRRRGESPPKVSSVREYTTGDNVSAIHWPASARMGQLMTKLFDPQVQTTLWLALDLDGELAEDVEDLLVTTAASLAMYALHEANLRVGLVASGVVPATLPAERGKAHQYRMQEVLATVHPGAVAALSDQLTTLDRQLGPGQVVVLVTTRGPATWGAWIARLVYRGIAARVVEVQPGTGVAAAPATSKESSSAPAISTAARDAGQAARWMVPAIFLPVDLADIANERSLVNYLEGWKAAAD
jgi:uncharacterized protein (DUF58 family)